MRMVDVPEIGSNLHHVERDARPTSYRQGKMKYFAILVLFWSISGMAQPSWRGLPGQFCVVPQMRFFDRDTGFVLSRRYVPDRDASPPDTIWKTTNGGSSWQIVALPFDSSFRIDDFYEFKKQLWLACAGDIHGV